MVIIVTSNRKKCRFVLIVYSMLGKEALVVLANMSQIMAEKMEEQISHVQGWANSRI